MRPGRGGGASLSVHAQGNLHPVGHHLGPLMRSVQPPVRTGDQAPREPTLGPLRHSAFVRLHPGDPVPSGPPLGPLRCPVERSGGLGKGRNLRQNRAGQNQGQRRGHSAAQITRDTMRSRARGAHAHGNTERHVVGALWTEARGQETQSNDPRNNQHNSNTPTTGRR